MNRVFLVYKKTVALYVHTKMSHTVVRFGDKMTFIEAIALDEAWLDEMLRAQRRSDDKRDQEFAWAAYAELTSKRKLQFYSCRKLRIQGPETAARAFQTQSDSATDDSASDDEPDTTMPYTTIKPKTLTGLEVHYDSTLPNESGSESDDTLGSESDDTSGRESDDTSGSESDDSFWSDIGAAIKKGVSEAEDKPSGTRRMSLCRFEQKDRCR